MVELTQKDEKIASLLSETGLKRTTARIIVYLYKAGESESSSIEGGANLRQPEVSLAMKELKDWGWVNERELRRKGKGRPIKSYKLALDIKDIVHEVVNKKQEELKKTKKDLAELERVIS